MSWLRDAFQRVANQLLENAEWSWILPILSWIPLLPKVATEWCW
jgi:hypothetical protein